jgi:hypothetical protein
MLAFGLGVRYGDFGMRLYELEAKGESLKVISVSILRRSFF